MIKIDDLLLSTLSEKAKKSTRKRINHNFHKEYSDLLQRMLNAIEPNSYIRPHKHENPDKREIFIILKGKMVVVEFDDNGDIIDHTVLDASKGVFGVEISVKSYHTIFSLEEGSIAYEIKDGPYIVSEDKNFASWAPAEDDINASGFLQNLKIKLNL